MNKVTVTNVANFEDCCTWISRFHGEKAREQFEAHITRIKPLISIAGSRLTPQVIVEVHKTLEGLLREDNVMLYNTCHYIENKYGKHALRRYQRLLTNQENSAGRELNDTEILNLYNQFTDELCRTVMTRQGK